MAERPDLDVARTPVPVRVVPVVRRSAEAPLRLAGRFAARRRVRIKAPASGVVEGLALEVGDRVEKGAELAAIGAGQARLRALSTDAQIHQLQAQRLERADQLALAEARGEPAERLASLTAKLQMVDERLAQERIHQRRHRTAESTLIVHAPFDARVAELAASPGGAVMTGTPLLSLVAIDPIRLLLDAPTWLARRCRTGQAVTVETSGGEAVEGTVARWAPTSADDVRRVEVDVPNGEARFADGETAAARLDVGARDALFVPRTALRETERGAVIQVVEHGRVSLRRAYAVGGGEAEVELAGHIEAGQLVVVHAEAPLEEDSAVTLLGDH